MDRIRNKNQKLIFNLIYICFVFSLVYLFGLGMDLKLNILLQMFVVLLGSTAVKFFLLNPLVLYGLLGVSFLGIILVHRFVTPILFILTERAFYLFDNIAYNLQGKENIASDNLILFWIILVVLVSFYTSFILFKGKSIYLLPPVYISFFLYYWYNYFDEAYFMISTFLFAFFILISLDKYSRENVNIEDKSEQIYEKLYTARLKTVTVYSILIILLAIILPKKNNYLEWPWLQDKVYSAFPFVEKLRYQDDYSRKTGEAALFNFSITGYQSDSSKLGGPVNLSDKKIMTVLSDTDIYLRGNVRHTYTGDSWKTISMPSGYYALGQDFSELSKHEQNTYYKQIDITITNHSFASTTIFSPYKAAEVKFNSNNRLIVDRDNILVFTDGIYDGESYIVKVQKPLPYGILVSLGINEKKEDLTDLEFYLQVPHDKITKRTETLVKEIVKGSNNDFQKAVAIEDYLRNNYKYKLDVENVPAHEEFIDYFLFNGQEGYCTYYATAMAVMLRLEGIPSRYVEGYLAHEEVEPGMYEISHENAHAWVEAFIEPVGWMTFEPTPAYDIQNRLENYQLPLSEKDEFLNETIKNNRDPRINTDDPLIDPDQNFVDIGLSPNLNNNLEDESTQLPKYIGYIFIGLLLLILPMRFLIGFLYYVYQESKSKKWSINKRIIYKYNKIIKTTELLGFPQEYGETHYEYANRIAYKFYSHNEKGINEITEIFVKSKYSDSIAALEDMEDLDRYMASLDKRLRNSLGPIAYYYQKYVKRGYLK